MSWTWSPYNGAPLPCFPRHAMPMPGESPFITRQLEYIRPRMYAITPQQAESIRRIPLKAQIEQAGEYRVELALDARYPHVGVVPSRREVPAPAARTISPPAPPPVEVRTWRDGTVTVQGTFAQVRDYFEARGCRVMPHGPRMCDASGYRITDAIGRWVCDFKVGWRGGRALAHWDRPHEGHDLGDEG